MPAVKAADILLPRNADLSKWSVIACDQYTSDISYWKKVEEYAEASPTTYRLILPEAYLGLPEAEGATERISNCMEQYLNDKVFRCIQDSFIYVKREMLNGTVRHGVVGAVDLECYDWRPEAVNKIKATERTVEERLYKRLEVRQKVCLELPHVLVFYSDKEDALTCSLEKRTALLEPAYDFELMQGGGRITGYALSAGIAEAVEKYFNMLELEAEKNSETMLAVGDGNHSLATAKLNWDRIKENLSPGEREIHPARYALVELINVYDSGIEIEPIHRVVKGVDTETFTAFYRHKLETIGSHGTEYTVEAGNAAENTELYVCLESVGALIAATDIIISEYISENGGEVDYIHDRESATEIGSLPDSAYILLPAVKKDDIFKTASRGEIFPKKSFSIGHAAEKRYYLEARRIK